jgi:hypothetical protein
VDSSIGAGAGVQGKQSMMSARGVREFKYTFFFTSHCLDMRCLIEKCFFPAFLVFSFTNPALVRHKGYV